MSIATPTPPVGVQTALADTYGRVRRRRRWMRKSRASPHDPDGVPHRVIGYLALAIVMLALVAGFMMTAGGSTAMIIAVVIGAPIVIYALSRRADSGRDHHEP